MKLILDHLDILLRFVAALQIGLSILNLFIGRILNWKPHVDAMDPLVREVFVIHSYFITITVALFGILTWRFAPLMAHEPTELSRWLCAGMGSFWAIRSVLQWTHYSPSHWRGKADRTVIHWLLFVGYAAWATTYFLTLLP